MKAIYKREVSSYFNSMIGWIFVAVLTVFIGIYFFAYNLFQGYPYFSLSLGSSLFIFMVVVPILTMRSMADERHTKTDQAAADGAGIRHRRGAGEVLRHADGVRRAGGHCLPVPPSSSR